MIRYSTKPRTRKYVKGYGFLPFARNWSNKYEEQLLETRTKTGLDALKTAFKRVIHKTIEATGEVISTKIVHKILKPKLVCDENSRMVKKQLLYQRREIFNELRQVLERGKIVILPEKRNTEQIKTTVRKRNTIKYLDN